MTAGAAMADHREPPPVFAARWPWLTGDLQTLRNAVTRPRAIASSAARTTLTIDLDGGDRLLARVDRPMRPAAGAACAVLVHGLTGCSESRYMLASAEALLARGHDVVRVNLRGAGAGRALARGHYDAGSSADLAVVLRALPGRLTASGIVVIGFSLGANIVLKLLGEGHAPAAVAAAVSVSAPIDLAAASRRIRSTRNAVYHAYLLRRMKREALAAPDGPDAALRLAIRTAHDIRAFDDRVVAPSAGFAGVDDYYARCSAQRFLAAIATPTLVIHAADDPWIPVAAYAAQPWARWPRLVPILTAGGGHVGFHGRGSATAWHDRVIAWFLRGLGLACEGIAPRQRRSAAAASTAK